MSFTCNILSYGPFNKMCACSEQLLQVIIQRVAVKVSGRMKLIEFLHSEGSYMYVYCICKYTAPGQFPVTNGNIVSNQVLIQYRERAIAALKTKIKEHVAEKCSYIIFYKNFLAACMAAYFVYFLKLISSGLRSFPNLLFLLV